MQLKLAVRRTDLQTAHVPQKSSKITVYTSRVFILQVSNLGINDNMVEPQMFIIFLTSEFPACDQSGFMGPHLKHSTLQGIAHLKNANGEAFTTKKHRKLPLHRQHSQTSPPEVLLVLGRGIDLSHCRQKQVRNSMRNHSAAALLPFASLFNRKFLADPCTNNPKSQGMQ